MMYFQNGRLVADDEQPQRQGRAERKNRRKNSGKTVQYGKTVKKPLGNEPKKWLYNPRSKKLVMLFEDGGTLYVLKYTALLTDEMSNCKIATLGNGTEYILWNDRQQRRISLLPEAI